MACEEVGFDYLRVKLIEEGVCLEVECEWLCVADALYSCIHKACITKVTHASQSALCPHNCKSQTINKGQ